MFERERERENCLLFGLISRKRELGVKLRDASRNTGGAFVLEDVRTRGDRGAIIRKRWRGEKERERERERGRRLGEWNRVDACFFAGALLTIVSFAFPPARRYKRLRRYSPAALLHALLQKDNRGHLVSGFLSGAVAAAVACVCTRERGQSRIIAPRCSLTTTPATTSRGWRRRARQGVTPPPRRGEKLARRNLSQPRWEPASVVCGVCVVETSDEYRFTVLRFN